MTTRAYIQSDKNPDIRYYVKSFNPDTKTATIAGRGAEFEIHPFTKEKLAEDGYTLKIEEVPDAKSPGVSP
jgi:hypothetical protein